jgi:dihydroflavonol-4-reductase
MKALVIGASGHIGNAITRELLARGHEVTATGRRAEVAQNLVGLAAHYIPGNLDTPGQMDTWIEGQNLVVDAAAPYPSRLLGGTEEPEKNPLRHASLRMHNLLDSVRRHRVTLVYVSSFTTLVHKRDGFSQLPMQLVRQLHPYFAVKELMESEVLAAARNGLPTIIVNPTLCLGPWDAKERKNCFIPALLRGEISMAVNQVLNVIDVRDVAVGLMAALEAQRYGEPILLSGHNISNEALFQWICEIGGVRPPGIVAPSLLSVVASYWTEITMEMAGLRPPLPALAAMLTYMHEWLPASRTQTELGIVPRPLSATITDSIKWYAEIGYC